MPPPGSARPKQLARLSPAAPRTLRCGVVGRGRDECASLGGRTERRGATCQWGSSVGRASRPPMGIVALPAGINPVPPGVRTPPRSVRRRDPANPPYIRLSRNSAGVVAGLAEAGPGSATPATSSRPSPAKRVLRRGRHPFGSGNSTGAARGVSSRSGCFYPARSAAGIFVFVN
jgi:hypothetical protein